MKKALITGATGFIGSHLVRRLVHQDVEIHVLCRSQSRFDRLADLRGRFAPHVTSLADRSGLRRLVRRLQPDYVVHLGAATMHGGVSPSTDALVRTTLLGTINLIDACDDVDYSCLVNTGDAFEYGPGRRAAKESARCRPTTIDGITKLAATLYAQRAARARNKPIVTVRPFSVYGPRDDVRRLVPRVIAGARSGTPLSLSRPRIARDFLYVNDLMDLYLKVLRHGPQLGGTVLNAGSGRMTTIAEIVDAVLKFTRSTSEVRWGSYPSAAHDAQHLVADITRARRLVGWRPRTSIDKGLAATIRLSARLDSPEARHG